MSGSNEFLWEVSCVSNSNWLTYKVYKMIKDVCPHVQAVFTSRAVCVGKGSGGGFSVGESSQDTHGILEFHWHFLLQEGGAEERKHFLAELGHIQC